MTVRLVEGAPALDADGDGPARVLAVTAHPDDVDFGASGLVATWTDAGVDVHYLVVTSGDSGGFTGAEPGELIRVRRAEQVRAAARLGVTDVRFLDGFADGGVVVGEPLVREITRAIRGVRPHAVLTLSPERDWDRLFAGHPDHLAVGEATVRAVHPYSRNPYAFPELLAEDLQEWIVAELWLMGHPAPNLAVDVSAQLDRKVAAIGAHTSQLAAPQDVGPSLSAWFARDCARAGVDPPRPVELFRRVDVHERRPLRVVRPGA